MVIKKDKTNETDKKKIKTVKTAFASLVMFHIRQILDSCHHEEIILTEQS